MSLMRQLWLLLGGIVLLAMLASAHVHVSGARDSLAGQLTLKNRDNAQALALTLTQLGARGNATDLEIALAAQFDIGAYESIRLVAPDGRVIAERRAAPPPVRAPRWFAQQFTIDSPPGQAQVAQGWSALGTLEVVGASAYAVEELWQASQRAAGALLVIAVLACLLGSLVLVRVRAGLNAMVGQAKAILDRRFTPLPLARTPELRALGAALNSLGSRLETMLQEQGAQMETLRRQAFTDDVTGLPLRAPFLARVVAEAGSSDGPGWLVLVRLRSMAELNHRFGHRAVDDALRALAGALNEAATAVGAWACTARLNGSDFVLAGPLTAPAREGAQWLAQLQVCLAPWPGCTVAMAVVPWQAGSPAAATLRTADEGLARAEMQPGFAIDIAEARHESKATGQGKLPSGAFEWREHLQAALDHAALHLQTVGTVLGRDGRVLHHLCELQLRPDSVHPEALPAERWRPWAQRCGLNTALDLAALRLARHAAAPPGAAPRAVTVAWQTLGDAAFSAQLRTLLAQPAARNGLIVQMPADALATQAALLKDRVLQLRARGVPVGVLYDVARTPPMSALYEAGLHHVRLEAALVESMAGDRARESFVRQLAASVHGIGLQLHIDAPDDASDADVQALWACGADAVKAPRRR